jgi:outer membrane protein OmpA-like peptidoglycan-associated protein
MRATLAITAAFAFAAVLGCTIETSSPGWAADTPTTDQIINSLTPPGSGGMATRGIRLGGQPPTLPKPGTDASTGGTTPPGEKPPEVNLSVPFASGSAAISPVAAHVLDQLGAALASPKLTEYKFRVEGHTDTVGRPETNKVLSQQRAASVINYLMTKHGIDRSRLTAVGMGEDGLLVETGPGVHNSANRRVLVVNLGH